MINVVSIQGNLTRDPELRTTQSGKSVASFTVAVPRYGEGCDFIPCVAWERKADVIAQYFKKGAQIAVVGQLQSRQYADKSGANRTTYEVKVDDFAFCGKKDEPEFEVFDDEPLPFG